jgi:SAM-dependent methyltransferase
MRQDLLDILICPACLPAERPLRLSGARRAGNEILAGTLDCRTCGRVYPIEEGLAVLLAEPGTPATPDKYDQPATVSAYLWSHFADLAGDPDAFEAYRQWAALVPAGEGLALDLGCAVGRMSFELAACGGLVVGLDRSRPLVAKARQLARDGTLDYPLTLEGRLSELRRIELPAAWHRHPPEFLVADALALPFPAQVADCLCSLNLLDKLPQPRRHLAECDRVAAGAGACLLVSDPYSWSTECAAEEDWLGGTDVGPYAGFGRDNLRRILEREGEPPWRVTAEGQVAWTIRNHRNHFELIRSQYLRAER